MTPKNCSCPLSLVKTPLNDLPKSIFNLDDWKRAYSNKDLRRPDGALE
jgi:elongation factor 1-gamma